MRSTLPYVYSDFSAHSLIPTAGIVSSVVAAVLRLPLSKVLDLWGRAQGFAISLAAYTLGIVILAACQNVTTYATASVFHLAGYDGMFYVLYVVIADNFSLTSRGFFFGLYNAPYFVTTWVGSPLASRFLTGAGWRWSFGTFAIAAPILGLPIILLLYHEYNVINVRYAEGKHETAWDGIKYYWVEFDCIGVLLLAVAFSLLLLPFSLYARQDKGWASPAIICMLVFSGVAFSLFAIWEKFFASKCFLPVGLMRDRTIIGASIASANTYLVYYVWSSYFSSHLQVVQGLSVTTAGYVASIHSLGWVVAGIVAGALVSATGQYKWIALYVGWPLQTLAMGLIVHLSQADSRLGLIVMAQIFLAVADGLIYLASEIAVLAVIEPEHIAVVLAAYNMTTAVFQGIGSTISGAVWTNDFPANLARHLPNDVQPQLMAIYSSLRTQLSFPEGSLARVAIVESYLGASRKLFIISTSLTVIGLMTTLVWRNVRVSNMTSRA